MCHKYDFVVVNLKVISKIPRNGRIRMTTDGFFTLVDENIFNSLMRKLYGESRYKTVKNLNYFLSEIESLLRLLYSNKVEETETDENRSTIGQIATVYKELENSIVGFENLKSTYEQDKLTVGKIEVIIDKVHMFMQEIRVKSPTIPVFAAENFSAITSNIEE